MPNKEVNEKHLKLMGKIGNELRKLRESKGLNIQDMAKELKMSRNGYSKMERGLVYYNISTLLDILQYHDVSIKNFISKL